MSRFFQKAGQRLRWPAFLLLGLVLGCQSVPDARLQRFSFQNTQMGTLFTITLYATNQIHAELAAEAAFARILRLDEILSDYRADSELNLLREVPPARAVPVSRDLFDVLEVAQLISRHSDGAFDVTAGPFVRLWRFSRKRHLLPNEHELATARRACSFKLLELDARASTVTLKTNGMQLDVGGIAKGFAADAALRVLHQHGISRALIAASGDLSIGDPPPGRKGWRVEISGDSPPRRVLLRNCGVSTSGSAEQFVEIDGVRYSHIINPRTGLGLTNGLQATVIAPRAALSDPLATTLCVMGPSRGFETLRHFHGVHALVYGPGQGGVSSQKTGGFPPFLAD